jgi:cyanophycinase
MIRDTFIKILLSLNNTAVCLSILILLIYSSFAAGPPREAMGHLIIIGGGSPRPTEIMQKFVELAGGSNAIIGVIPMASEIPRERGDAFLSEFQGYGAGEVHIFYIRDSLQANADSTVNALSRCTGFFFGGGDQNRLTHIFNETRSMQVFHRRYLEGAVVGGTSAGAAIMSEIMITGGGNWTVLSTDSVDYMMGFGFLKNAIIDQHFIERNRFNRLLSMVIQHRLPGIGIDRLTAVWVKPGGEMEVMGERVVLVLQPSPDSFSKDSAETPLTASDIRLDVYKAGDIFHLK